MIRFFGWTGEVALVAIALTPEMTTALSIFVAAIFVGLVNLYVARTQRLLAMAEIAKAVAPVVAAVAAVDTKADVIKHSVDGTASRMEATLASALLTIEQLRADKVDQKEIIIAQATTDSKVTKKKPEPKGR